MILLVWTVRRVSPVPQSGCTRPPRQAAGVSLNDSGSPNAQFGWAMASTRGHESTRGPSKREKKRGNGSGRGKKKRDFLGGPAEGGPAEGGPPLREVPGEREVRGTAEQKKPPHTVLTWPQQPKFKIRPPKPNFLKFKMLFEK